MPRLARGALLGLSVVTAYALGAGLGLALRFPDTTIAPIWPPNGVLLAALLLTRTRHWWLWLLAVVPAHLAIHLPLGVPPLRLALQIAHNSLLVVLAAGALRRLLGGPPRLNSLRNVCAYLATVTAAATLAGAGLSAALVAAGLVTDFALSWRLIAFSNLLAFVTLVPAAVLTASRWRAWLDALVGWRAVEAATLAAALLLVAGLVYGRPAGEPDNIPALIYALLPLLLWAAVRFGPGGVSLATTTVMLLAIWQTSNGRGPFLGAAAIENVFNLQAYFLAFAAPLMLLAALIEERRRGATVLVALNAALEGRVAARTRALGQTNRQLAAARDQAVRTVGLLRHEVAERERAEASLQQRVAELEALNQIARALTGWTSLGSGLAAAAPLIRGLLDVATVSVWVEETPGGTLQRALAAGTSGVAGAPALLDEERARLLLRGPALTVAPLAAEDDLVACPCADGGHPGTYPALLVVLRARGEPTGLLCARAARPDRQFPPDQLALAETVGGLLATALDNARLLAEAQAAAAEQERQRLARDLHDSVSQALFAANRTAEVLPLLWELDPEEGQRALRDLSSFTGSALADMRALLLELRPKALIETPLHVTLGHLATVFAGKARVVVEPAIEPAPPLPPHPQLTLYRIAQEALNNVAKHACASRVVVGLAVAPPVEGAVAWAGTVVLTVADDGRGFDPDAAPAGGIGLASLRERAAEIGAELEIVSRPGGGTRVRVAWRQG